MRLLLAEDEKELSDAICAILKHQKYTVDAVYNGEDALQALQNEDYDGAILDIMMPRMDGITVLKTIREENNKTPILMLTAKSGLDDRVLGLDCGADDYLGKPFSMKELLARIRAITRRQSEHMPGLLQAGNVSLERSSFALKSPTGNFRLTNKEYQMMEMLMANPKQAITTEHFINKIWSDSDTDTSVVWIYISYLSKKLKSLNANISIKVIEDQGYILEIFDD